MGAIHDRWQRARDSYTERMRPYLEVEVDNLKGTVDLDEVRWIADGSGHINWADGSRTRFYRDGGCIETFGEAPSLDESLAALLDLKTERDKALEKIMWGG